MSEAERVGGDGWGERERLAKWLDIIRDDADDMGVAHILDTKVEREGEELGVPIHELTNDELQAKAATYRKMGAACFAHADEIERFLADRSKAA